MGYGKREILTAPIGQIIGVELSTIDIAHADFRI